MWIKKSCTRRFFFRKGPNNKKKFWEEKTKDKIFFC